MFVYVCFISFSFSFIFIVAAAVGLDSSSAASRMGGRLGDAECDAARRGDDKRSYGRIEGLICFVGLVGRVGDVGDEEDGGEGVDRTRATATAGEVDPVGGEEDTTPNVGDGV